MSASPVNGHHQVTTQCLKSANRRHRACISWRRRRAPLRWLKAKSPGQRRGFEDFDFLLSIRRLRQTVVLLRSRIIAYSMPAHLLWQQRCLEVASRLHHVGVVDETRRTYRHHGRQRDAPRRIATFHHATLRVAPHRYATLEPLGKPGGSRAFSADSSPQAPANLMPAIQAMRNAGALTLSEIASALNARGARPARGGKWHRSSVRNLLARIK